MYPRIENIYANCSEYQKIYGFLQTNKSSHINKSFDGDIFNKFMYEVFEKYHTQDIITFDNAQQQELENDLLNKFGSNGVFSYRMNDFNDFLGSKYIAELTNKNKEFNRSYIQKWFYEFATNVYNNKIRLENEKFKQLIKEIDTAINSMPTKEHMQSQQIATLEIQNIELQRQIDVLQKKLQEMENANNQLQNKNQELTSQYNDLLRQNQQSNQQSQNLTTEAAENVGDMEQNLPSGDIHTGNQENQQMENTVNNESIMRSTGFNEDQSEQAEENNEFEEDFEEEESDEGDQVVNKDDFKKKINEISKYSEEHKLSKEDKKNVIAALAKLEKFNKRVIEQIQKLSGYEPKVATDYLKELKEDSDIKEIEKSFEEWIKSKDSGLAQDVKQSNKTNNTNKDLNNYDKFFNDLSLEDEALTKKIQDAYKKISDVDKENKKQLSWTKDQVKVTILLLKNFYMEHNRLPDDREEDNDFCEKMQNAVGRKIQCTSFVSYINKYYKSLYTGFIMNGKEVSERQPDIELNENAVKIFLDEFKKVRTAYEKLTGHKDFKIPATMIVGNIVYGPDKNRCNDFVTTILDPNDKRAREKIFNRVKSDKFINKFETELNDKNESEKICWKFLKGGVAKSSLVTSIDGKGIKKVLEFKINIICLCARREFYKFIIQYCLHKKDQIKFKELKEELNKKVSGQKEVSEQEKAFIDEVKSSVSNIFNDNIISKPNKIKRILNNKYIVERSKKFKDCILNDMIGKINSYMEDENQIKDISERLAIAYGLKENKVLKDGENGALDYYDEELKRQLGSALNELSNEINKRATKKQK